MALPVERSKNKEKQKRDYSGKKKKHTRKNIIVCDKNKRILLRRIRNLEVNMITQR